MAEVKLTPSEAMTRAVAAFQRGQLNEAVGLAHAILKVQTDHFDALHLIAIANAHQRLFDDALANYDRALALRPDDAVALNNRGNTLNELKRFDEALANYERALAVRPDYAEALNNLGVALHALKRFDEALERYERALAARPDYARALYNRGVTLHELKVSHILPAHWQSLFGYYCLRFQTGGGYFIARKAPGIRQHGCSDKTPQAIGLT
jgi:tetratricopeptide (TPR) repeat protein